MPTRVVICDPDEIWRVGVRAVLADDPDIDVVGEAANYSDAMTQIRNALPDVVLVDIDLPKLGAIRLAEEISSRWSNGRLKVIVVSGKENEPDLVRAVHAGASGYLPKSAAPARIQAAVHDVVAGGAVMSPLAIRRMLDRFKHLMSTDPGHLPPSMDLLTRRERSVLMLIAKGDSGAQVADALRISEATVKSHVSHILVKLQLRDRAQAVAMAYKAGLVRPDQVGAEW